MNRRCENCGRPLLRSDDKCYHCNTPVPQMASDELSDESKLELSFYVRYILFILVLMLIGLYLMSWMGKDLKAPQALPEPTPIVSIQLC